MKITLRRSTPYFVVDANQLASRTKFIGEGEGANVVSRYASIPVTRQVRVLDLVCRGRSNKEIALELGVTESDVKYHVSQLLRANGVESRVELVVKVFGRGEAR